jgi:dihydroorotate dehydrogenase
MFHPLLRTALFALDPERAHELALSSLARLAARPRLAQFARRALARPRERPVRLLGLTFPHRVGLAAGFDKNGIAPLAWWALGFGFIEVGTVTPRAQPGNEKPRLFRLPRARALVNRMGFNNDGAEAVAARLAAQRSRGVRPAFPIFISVGKNADTPLERAEEDYAAAAAALAPQADALTLNISSPNTEGLRSLQAGEPVARLVTAVRRAAPRKPVLVKVAPELDGADLRAVADAALDADAAGLIATNTRCTAAWPQLPPGGLSGRPLRGLTPRRIELLRRYVGDRAVLIGCGGVDGEPAVRAMLGAGADLVQLYTALVYEGPFIAARLSRA